MSRVSAITGVAGTVPSRTGVPSASIQPVTANPLAGFGRAAGQLGTAISIIGGEMDDSRRRQALSQLNIEARDNISQLHQQVDLERDPDRKVQIMREGLKDFQEDRLDGIRSPIEREQAQLMLEDAGIAAMGSTRQKQLRGIVDNERSTFIREQDALQRALIEADTPAEVAEIHLQYKRALDRSGAVFSAQEREVMGQQFKQQATEEQAVKLDSDINQTIAEQPVPRTPQAVSRLAAMVQVKADEAIEKGLTVKQARNAAVGSVIRSAQDNGSFQMLKALREVEIGGVKVSTSSVVRNQIAAAAKNIAAGREASDARMWKIQERTRSQAREKMKLDATLKILDGASYEDVERELRRTAGDFLRVADLESIRVYAANRVDVVRDAEEVIDLHREIYTNPQDVSVQDVTDLAMAGKITQPTMRTILNTLKQNKEGVNGDMFGDNVVRSWASAIEAVLDPTAGSSRIRNVKQAKAAAQGQVEYYTELRDFREENPKAKMSEIRREAERLYKLIVDPKRGKPEADIGLAGAGQAALALTQPGAGGESTRIVRGITTPDELSNAVRDWNNNRGRAGLFSEALIANGVDANDQEAVAEFFDQQLDMLTSFADRADLISREEQDAVSIRATPTPTRRSGSTR